MTNPHRKQFTHKGFSADLIQAVHYPCGAYNVPERIWVVGSCSSPPLGTAEEMDKYAHFICALTDVCSLLNRPTLTDNDRAIVNQYLPDSQRI